MRAMPALSRHVANPTTIEDRADNPLRVDLHIHRQCAIAFQERIVGIHYTQLTLCLNYYQQPIP